MRSVLIVGLLLIAAPAMACNADMIVVEDWTVDVGSIEWADDWSEDTTIIDVSYRYTADRASRLIDAMIVFEDAVGGYISELRVPRDEPLSPEGTSNTTIENTYTNAARLPEMNPDDVVVTTCVRSVVYEDGTSEEF